VFPPHLAILCHKSDASQVFPISFISFSTVRRHVMRPCLRFPSGVQCIAVFAMEAKKERKKDNNSLLFLLSVPVSFLTIVDLVKTSLGNANPVLLRVLFHLTSRVGGTKVAKIFTVIFGKKWRDIITCTQYQEKRQRLLKLKTFLFKT